METNSGSWPLSRALEEHINPHSPTLLYTSYADNLKFIKNNSHKDSLKTLKKNKLNRFQVVNKHNHISLRFACVINKILVK